MIVEFNIGDIVTFKPYDEAHKMEVISIQKGMFGYGLNYFSGPDDRIFYGLIKPGEKGKPTSLTTGKSIVESNLFDGIKGKLL